MLFIHLFLAVLGLRGCRLFSSCGEWGLLSSAVHVLLTVVVNHILNIILHAAAAAAKSLQSCLTLSDPMDCSPPGSSAHGVFQARVLEWGAIAFSDVLHCVG